MPWLGFISVLPFVPGMSPASHSILDNLKSGTRSTVPFSKQECEDLLDAMTRVNCEKPDCICLHSLSHLLFS